MIMRWRTHLSGDQAAGATGGSLLPGFVGGFVASLCCLPPALALVLGLGVGGSTFLATLGAHEIEILLIGLGLTLAAAWWTLRRQAKACRINRRTLPFFIRIISAFAAAYLALLTIAHVVTPLLSGSPAGR
jgi:hypothetical protein